jgi:hypothetical protein
VENGEIELIYVPTEEMIAGGLTKALPKARFDQFVNLLGLQDLGASGSVGSRTQALYDTGA